MNKKIIIFILMGLFLVSFISAQQSSLGTFKRFDTVELRQLCASCSYTNISSVVYPNGSKAIVNITMNVDGNEFTYDFNKTDALGEYIVNGESDVDGIATSWAYTFKVTPTGEDVGDIGSYLGILVLIMFAISCFFLFLTTRTDQEAFKIFFLVISFIFLMGTMGVAIVITLNSGLPDAIGGTLTTILYVLGTILFIVFMFIMIRQTVAVLDMFRMKKGYLPNQTMYVNSGYNVIGRKGFY